MTTDKFHKYINKNIVINGVKINIEAICKGAGMIEPNMATMLSFINIDIKLPKKTLTKILKKSAESSFNRISVDGDMSTNDCVLMIASGKESKINFESDNYAYNILEKEIILICQDLSKMIIKDGEGATKVIQIEILKAANLTQAKKAAYTIANSNLIKTAIYGSDPNWGRIIAKLGSIDSVKYNPNKIILKINGHGVFEKGVQPKKFNITKLNKSMKKKEISIQIDLNNGKNSFSLLTSDLTKAYVHINSAYTS
jgi:glutamate N-acetyltransferase/amino-acid N-acetyltransferase